MKDVTYRNHSKMKVKNIRIEEKISYTILGIAKRVRDKIIKSEGNSTGMCYGASWDIVRFLKKKGIKSSVVGGHFNTDYDCGYWGESHYWVKIGDFILDVTADQFNHHLRKVKMGAIVYGKKSDLETLYNYRSCD
jgi:hypothetical protein